MALTDIQRDTQNNVYRLGSSLLRCSPDQEEYARRLNKRSHTSPGTPERAVANNAVAAIETIAGF